MERLACGFGSGGLEAQSLAPKSVICRTVDAVEINLIVEVAD
jgi:hypothetical protein